MKNECPAGCASGQGGGLRPSSPSELRLTPLVLAASRMQDGDQLLLCSACGRVVRRSFDSYVLHFRMESLGTYHAGQGRFEPKPWLRHEMQRLTMFSPTIEIARRDREPETDKPA